MKRYRRRQFRARIAIFALLALLWSQAVLAGHPACSLGFMALSEFDASAPLVVDGGTHGCHEVPAPSDDEVICASHCGQGSLSSDVARVPDVPALPAAIPVAMAEVVFLSPDPPRHHALPPPISWHRPTPHPAALLLI